MFKKILAFIARSQEIRARQLVRSQLQEMPDYLLEDLGFDRAAVAEGLDAWPWRKAAAAEPLESQPLFSRRELRRAERELAAMSDRELNELGIARGDIRAAVYGELKRAA